MLTTNSIGGSFFDHMRLKKTPTTLLFYVIVVFGNLECLNPSKWSKALRVSGRSPIKKLWDGILCLSPKINIHAWSLHNRVLGEVVNSFRNVRCRNKIPANMKNERSKRQKRLPLKPGLVDSSPSIWYLLEQLHVLLLCSSWGQRRYNYVF